MDPGVSMMALVQGSTQVQEHHKTCNCRSGAVNFCTMTHDYSKAMSTTPITKKNFRIFTNVISSLSVGSSKKQARKPTNTKAWESIRVRQKAKAEKKLAGQKKKGDKAMKRAGQLKAKFGDAYLGPSDVKRERSMTKSMEVEKKFHLEDDDDSFDAQTAPLGCASKTRPAKPMKYAPVQQLVPFTTLPIDSAEPLLCQP